jgi:hypothetical protein
LSNLSLLGRLAVAMALVLTGVASQASAGPITITRPGDVRDGIGADTQWGATASEPSFWDEDPFWQVRDNVPWGTTSDAPAAWGTAGQTTFPDYTFARQSEVYCWWPPPWGDPPPPWGWFPPPGWGGWWPPGVWFPPWWEPPPPGPWPHSTPDGGATLMLLGGALVGLGALRRKLGG